MHPVSAGRLALACALSALIPATAHAQAFPQGQGEGRVIASVIYSQSAKGFDDDGDVIDIPDYDKTEIYLLAEYGLTDDLTLLATPSFRAVSIEGADDSSGFGFTDLGARYRLVDGGNFVLSLQGLVRIPGQKWQDRLAQIGQTDMEYDLRGQAGLSFGQGHFAILESGYRLRAGDPPNEFHIDATLGIRAAPRFLLLANSYNTISDGRGEGIFPNQRYHNVYVGAAYEVTPRITLQLGGMGTVAGRNALRERGAFGGVWFQF